MLLRRATGVDFNHYKSPTITRRIFRRMALHRLSSLAEYVRRLEELGDDAYNPNQLEFEFEDDEEDDGSSLVDEVEQFLRDQDGN